MISVAFDVDGTLLHEESDTAVEDIRTLMRIFRTCFRDVHIIVWSGSGVLYAHQRAAQLHIGHWVDEYAVKGSLHPDIIIDDVETTNLGKINLILKGRKALNG